MNPTVTTVRPLANHQLLLRFSNGEARVFDLSPYLELGVFRRLRAISAFAGARVVAGSVEWQGGIDLSYDTLYLESRPVADASVERAIE